MKTFSIKWLVFFICLILVSGISLAQDKKLKVHAVSVGAGIATSSSETAKTGLGLNLDFSTIVDRHIISFYTNAGFNLNPDGFDEAFTEWNITYGRKWALAPKLSLEGHLGLGLFVYDLLDDDDSPNFTPSLDLPENTIGFPLRAKLIYYPTEKFGVGINPNTNINSVATTFAVSFIVQYQFN